MPPFIIYAIFFGLIALSVYEVVSFIRYVSRIKKAKSKNKGGEATN